MMEKLNGLLEELLEEPKKTGKMYYIFLALSSLIPTTISWLFDLNNILSGALIVPHIIIFNKIWNRYSAKDKK